MYAMWARMALRSVLKAWGSATTQDNFKRRDSHMSRALGMPLGLMDEDLICSRK